MLYHGKLNLAGAVINQVGTGPEIIANNGSFDVMSLDNRPILIWNCLVGSLVLAIWAT